MKKQPQPSKPPEPPRRKRLLFLASSLDDLRAFPVLARQAAGFELNNVEEGKEPADWKPMPTIGAGAIELRVWDEAGTFRVIYVAKFESAIYVLHCFQKKTQRTSKADIDLAAALQRPREGVEAWQMNSSRAFGTPSVIPRPRPRT